MSPFFGPFWNLPPSLVWWRHFWMAPMCDIKRLRKWHTTDFRMPLRKNGHYIVSLLTKFIPLHRFWVIWTLTDICPSEKYPSQKTKSHTSNIPHSLFTTVTFIVSICSVICRIYGLRLLCRDSPQSTLLCVRGDDLSPVSKVDSRSLFQSRLAFMMSTLTITGDSP